ncbi:MAG: hypothetical protein QGH45_09845 [Myxococcota bacterium]|nr:hypothetical protein [Myxococcota bacterium]
MTSERPLCWRCVLPESPPDIRLDDDGLCNVCADHDAAHAEFDGRRPLETDFTKLLSKYRGKSEYDCLVMCSGGKDSTSALYYMVTRYGLKPLAFTFDHGFETREAMANVQRAVEKLNVDYLVFRSTEIHPVAAEILNSGSQAVICHLCSIWYMDFTFRVAARFKVPLIIAGWTKGQSNDQAVMSKCACDIYAPEYRQMGKATLEFLGGLGNDPRFKDFPRSMEDVLKRAKKRFKSRVLSPHWFIDVDTETYVETIQRELGWQYPEVSYPGKSTNCELNFLAVHNSLKYYGYTHYHIEMSKQIRDGQLTRDEALELLKPTYTLDDLNRVAEMLGYRFPDSESQYFA